MKIIGKTVIFLLQIGLFLTVDVTAYNASTACQFSFGGNTGYIETDHTFYHYASVSGGVGYRSLAIFFKITPKGKQKEHPQPVFAMYEFRNGTHMDNELYNIPQFLVMIRPFRFYVWGHPVVDENGNNTLGGELKPDVESDVKILIHDETTGGRFDYWTSDVVIKINDVDVFKKTKPNNLRVNDEGANRNMVEPMILVGGVRSDNATYEKEQRLYPYSPLEATVFLDKVYINMAVRDLSRESIEKIEEPFPLLDSANIGKEKKVDDRAGGWTWKPIGVVGHSRCPGGVGTTSTTEPTVPTTTPIPTTPPSTIPTTTTLPPPKILPWTQMPMVEEYEDIAPFADETFDQIMDAVEAAENPKAIEMSPRTCGAGCIAGIVVCVVVIIVVIALTGAYRKWHMTNARNVNQNRRKRKSGKTLYRALEAPNLIEKVDP